MGGHRLRARGNGHRSGARYRGRAGAGWAHARRHRPHRAQRGVRRAGVGSLAEWKLDPHDDRINPNGSGISLGHPIGATGARILATAAYEARRRDAHFVLETMCIGGGQGLAAVFEAIR